MSDNGNNRADAKETEELHHSSSFDINLFRERYHDYVRGQMSYAELERYAGGLPSHPSILRQLWDALEMAVGYTSIKRASPTLIRKAS